MAERITVLGAGHGGCAVAADLGRQGYKISLYSRTQETIQPIVDSGGLEYTGVIGEGFTRLETVTSNIDEALEGSRIIIITTPTTAHGWYAQMLAPRLKDDHIVMLNPGHTGGGLHFVYSLREAGFQKDLRTCETITITHGSRKAGPAKVSIFLVIPNLRLAAFPGKYLDELTPIIKEIFPTVVPAGNVLETGLTNLNAMEHPPGMLLNAGWIEFTKGDFRFYSEGISPSVALVIQKMDEERLEVVRALNRKSGLNMKEMTFIEYFYEAAFTSKRAVDNNDMYMALQDSEPNRTVKSPGTLDHRYVNEDVGFGLVPIYEVGRLVGVDMPVTKLMIDLAGVLRGVDYWQEGLTLKKLGLEGVPVERLQEFLQEGHL